MYQVVGRLRSRAFRILWLLEELDQPYQLIDAAPHSDAAYAVNPSGKIPALKDGDQLLTDSVAIMTYLTDKHGALTHAAGTALRAQQDALTLRLLDEVEAPLWMWERMVRIYPENRQVPEAVDTLKWEITRNLPRLADSLQGPFLMGDQMVMTDILATSLLRWVQADGIDLTDPRLTGYLDRMLSRPAFKRAAA